MQISDQKLDEFIDIYRNKFGIEIGREEALEKGIKLVRFMQIVYQSANNKKHAKYTKTIQ